MGKPGRRDLLKSLLLAGVVSQLPAAPAAANDHTVEKEFTLSTGGLDLKFDTRTGAWTELIDQKSDATVLKSSPDYSTCTLTIDGKESPFPSLLRPPGDEWTLGRNDRCRISPTSRTPSWTRASPRC